LRTKGPAGQSPHVIVMTATPIPRTAALATVGDLDVLSLRENPGLRAGVTSFVVHEELPRWEQRMWQRAAEEIAAGRQVFVVCARIDEDDADAPAPPELDEDGTASPPALAPARGVSQTARRLAERPELAGARIAVLHGRMSGEEKQETMAQMVRGEIDLLVSTTVIEVGVDVPNASTMIVLDAERFGVSQLHQLRGRVGRGEHPGIAFFDTTAEVGRDHSQHLQQIADAADGFALAELDLRRRGAGDLVGEEQSGLQRTLRHLDVMRDARAIEQAREDAFAVVAGDPELTAHPAPPAGARPRCGEELTCRASSPAASEAAPSRGRPGRAPGPPRTRSVRRCSIDSRAGTRSPAPACSISTQAPGPSPSRPSPAAPSTHCWSRCTARRSRSFAAPRATSACPTASRSGRGRPRPLPAGSPPRARTGRRSPRSRSCSSTRPTTSPPRRSSRCWSPCGPR